MTTARQAAVNRRNAKASTGPKTTAGKARVGRNALRHGLSANLPLSPEMDAEVEALAATFLNGARAPGALALAREAAEAQLHLLRARAVRAQMFNDALADPATYRRQTPAQYEKAMIKNLLAILPGRKSSTFVPKIEDIEPEIPATEAERQAWVFERVAPDLARLDRYERRALSRRKRALRELEQLR